MIGGTDDNEGGREGGVWKRDEMEKREGNVQVVSLRRGEEWRKKEKGKKKKRKEKKMGKWGE